MADQRVVSLDVTALRLNSSCVASLLGLELERQQQRRELRDRQPLGVERFVRLASSSRGRAATAISLLTVSSIGMPVIRPTLD